MIFFYMFEIHANSFINKILVCSTDKFPIKGGFKFTNYKKVERSNILLNHKTNQEFIKKSVIKSEARPFKAADGTIMMVVDPNTGQKAKFTSKNTIIEVYKKQNVVNGNVLYSNNDRLDTNNILKFY